MSTTGQIAQIVINYNRNLLIQLLQYTYDYNFLSLHDYCTLQDAFTTTYIFIHIYIYNFITDREQVAGQMLDIYKTWQ